MYNDQVMTMVGFWAPNLPQAGEAVQNVQWGETGDWREFVPEYLQRAWDELGFKTQICIYLVAEAASRKAMNERYRD